MLVLDMLNFWKNVGGNQLLVYLAHGVEVLMFGELEKLGSRV